MDRLTRTLAGSGLALLAAAGGCRTAHDEVPPGKVYRPDAPAGPGSGVGFSTTPASKGPGTFGAPNTLTQGNLGGMTGSRMPAGGDSSGNFPGSQFGAPGTSGAAMTPPGASLAPPPQTGGGPLSGLGQAPALGQPSAAPRDPVNYLNGFPTEPAPAGAMGSPGQPPSPL